MPRVALILSAGRTGTQFLARYFDANYPGVVARHEPPPSRSLRMAAHAHLAGRLSSATLARILRRARRRVDSLDADLYVESNPFLAGFAGVLAEVFPDATVVHVVRDPREHVRSSLNHGMSTGFKGWANRFVPFWYPDVRRILELERRPGWVGQAAGGWAILNRHLHAEGGRHPGYRRYRYEEMFDASHSGLRALCADLGLRYRDEGAAVSPGQRMNRGRLEVAGRWPTWAPSDCAEVERLCQPLMGEYGYGDEPEWREKVRAGG